MLDQVPQAVTQFDTTRPHFPDGRIDYTDATSAPVITCFVMYEGKLLLLRRSTNPDHVDNYHGLWNCMSGYLDEVVPLRTIVEQELAEELAVVRDQVASMVTVSPLEMTDASLGKIWLIHPVLVILKSISGVKLNNEHSEFVWIDPEDLPNYKTVPGVPEHFKLVFN